MTKDQNERIVVAYEVIGKALEGIHEEIIRAGARYWPAPAPGSKAEFKVSSSTEGFMHSHAGSYPPLVSFGIPQPQSAQTMV